TGPFKVDSFSPNDQVQFSQNDNYREPNKPFFSGVVLKGGGDAASAARAVIQTGEYDYAWNLQVEPEILKSMESDSAPGKLMIGPDVTVDRIELNLSDPNKEVNGEKSEMNTPHPFFSDIAVRQAVCTAIDREKLADTFWFGKDGEPAVSNLLEGIPAIQSQANHFEFDTDKANKILDDAGWAKDGKTRSKNDVELKLTYTCSVNQVNAKMQAVVKANLEAIGFNVQLNQVDPNILFDASPGNEQNLQHFYWDMQMFSQSLSSPRPFSYMRGWYAGKDGSNIAQKSNQWVGQNYSRFRNDDYDAALDQAVTETDPDAIAQAFIKMNDIVIQNHVEIPLIRVGQKVGISKKLNADNIALGPFTTQYWNIANWNKVG
ncbi:MAG TPA: ABC transporter substrate-binding protein, partial [Thermomicrobiales bacterium]|nr:ABC transporter substrate-binding protein [Thermomicrobiales bacterium]